MISISTNDMRPGMSIRHNGRLYQVVEYHHVKPGKGAAFVRAKLRDLYTGQIIDQTWKGEQKVDQVILQNRKYEYLYREGDLYYFMDLNTYEQTPLDAEKVGKAAQFLKENMEVLITFEDETPLFLQLPDFVQLRVVQTSPGVRGDTAAGGTKPATLETGAVIQVPLFINEGDLLKVDTRTGAYVERV